MKITVIIPGRLESTRFPRKLLARLGGKLVLEHTFERVMEMKVDKEVVIATDAGEIHDLAAEWGVRSIETPKYCRNGTERLCEVVSELEGNYFMNVQGDEVFVDSEILDMVANELMENHLNLVTPVFKIEKEVDLRSGSVVKVVLNGKSEVVYFSRSVIPFMQGVGGGDWVGRRDFWGHIGVYGYSRGALNLYKSTPVSELEVVESLEQLRFLDTEMRFQVIKVDYDKVAINTEEDLVVAEEYLRKMGSDRLVGELI